MQKERSFPWEIAIPLAIIACGVIILICNAFPYVHYIPGGLDRPSGYPGYPPTDQASAGDGHANLWQSFFAGGFTSLGGFSIILGFMKLLVRHRMVMSRVLTIILFLIALIGLLFTWLLGTAYFSDTNDRATFLPAGLSAICAYTVILVIIGALPMRKSAKVFEE